MPVGVGDQTTRTVLQVDPVELDLIKDLPGGLDHGFHVPAPLGLSAKGSSGLPRPDLRLGLIGT